MGLMTIMSIPILILNLTSGLIGVIWLIILGQWGIIIYGFVLGMVMPWAYSITVLPSMGIMFLLDLFQKHKNIFLVSLTGYFGSLYSNATVAIWVYFVFVSFMNRADQTTAIPILLLGYSTMLSPLSYMAKADGPDNFGNKLGILLAMVCYLTLTVIALIGYPSFTYLLIICGIFSFITMSMVSPVIASEMEKDKSDNLENELEKISVNKYL